jgi:hypothetical protein
MDLLITSTRELAWITKGGHGFHITGMEASNIASGYGIPITQQNQISL